MSLAYRPHAVKRFTLPPSWGLARSFSTLTLHESNGLIWEADIAFLEVGGANSGARKPVTQPDRLTVWAVWPLQKCAMRFSLALALYATKPKKAQLAMRRHVASASSTPATFALAKYAPVSHSGCALSWMLKLPPGDVKALPRMPETTAWAAAPLENEGALPLHVSTVPGKTALPREQLTSTYKSRQSDGLLWRRSTRSTGSLYPAERARCKLTCVN